MKIEYTKTISFSEEVVKKHYEKKGYMVRKIKPHKNKGIPDFIITKNKRDSFVEVKENNSDLYLEQEEKIKGLIKKGFIVFLVKFNNKKKILVFYKLDKHLGRKFLEEVKIK